MSDQDQYVDRTLKSARTFFARWEGAYASLLELTRSNRTMKLVLTHGVDEDRNLLVCCLAPVRIAGPFEWNSSGLEIARVELPDHEIGFRISDASAGFEILCATVEVKENVRL